MIRFKMILAFKRRVTTLLLALMFTFALPAMALASHDDEDKPTHDARLDQYPQSVVLDAGSAALTWFLVVLLAGLSVGVMFKSSNRTHLD
jgi:hypothetical protein